MNEKQHELISLIAERSFETEFGLACWCPLKDFDYSTTLKKEVWVEGQGVARSLKAMERKGWIKNHPKLNEFAYSITEDGRLALETHREKTNFYANGK